MLLRSKRTVSSIGCGGKCRASSDFIRRSRGSQIAIVSVVRFPKSCRGSRRKSDNQSLMRRHALFIGAFIIIAAARFAILLTSQTHVHSDEAIIGLMGKHILQGRHFPFYMYGQPYNAGAAWEAYLASVALALFGVGVVPLKGCIVLLSLLCLFLFYRMGCALYD